ncbi:MAG: hypothetical protein LBR00_00175 [Clostridiales Family XIII bacterium]|jgi:hypothetical protein|nr:hypothetical protein [Clostridiales Family XIII bacterium]
MIGVSIFYILSAAALFACVFFYPKSGERQNAVVWLAIAIMAYECWMAFLGGVLSLAHVPVSILSVGIANFVVAFLIYRFGIRGKKLQRYAVRVIDIVFAVALAVAVAYIAYLRFCTSAPIVYSTIDPVDRLSAAQHVVAAQSVIYTYPNMFFGHMANAMFMELLSPAFPDVLAFRAFEIKEAVNLWLAGLLFYAALRQYSGKNFQCGVFFALAFAYALGYPLNNGLYGFGYLGISVSLVIFTQIGAKLLHADGMKPWIGLAVISMGCFGVGVSYTLFAPPVYVAAFVAIALRARTQAEAKGDLCLVPVLKKEICVFAVPVILTVVFTMVVGRGDAASAGSQLTAEGAIFRNLYTDFLPYLPFAVLAVVMAARREHRDFARVLAVIFALFQGYFFVQMWRGGVSTYYYYKLNFAAWFLILFLAGLAADALANRKRSIAFLACYAVVWGLVGVVGVLGLEMRLTGKKYDINPVQTPASGVCFQVYSTNMLYLLDVGKNVVYLDWDFIELGAAARAARGESTAANYFENRVEPVCDAFEHAYWIDCLADEHIDQQPVTGLFALPESDAKIWVVVKDSELYKNNKARIYAYDRVFENDAGFVCALP